MSPVAQPQLAGHRHAPRLEAVDFADHAGRVEHDPAGDHALDPIAEDAAGDQGELPGLAAADHRMAGIGAALVANDQVVLLRKNVDELAFGLVTPLQSDDTGAGHG